MIATIDRRTFGLGFAATMLPYSRSLSAPSAQPSYEITDKRIALVIANWKYRFVPCSGDSSACSLNSPRLNARAIAQQFKRMGYEVETMDNADFDKLATVVARFPRIASLSTMAVMYYAGHGLQIGGSNYLVPVDVKADYSELIKGCVPLAWGSDSDWNADAVGLEMLDACRENPFVDALRKTPGMENIEPRISAGLAPIEPPGYFLISFATRANKVALDGDPIGLTPYARAVLKQLENTDTSIQDIFARISNAVCDSTSPGTAAATDEVDQCQRPEVYSNLGAEPFFLTKSAKRRGSSSSPLLVNLRMANPEDPAVAHLLGDNDEFKFRYLWQDTPGQNATARIIPDIDYFTSRARTGRSFIVPKSLMYYDPRDQDTSLWSLAFPLVDLIARKLSANPVSIDRLEIETKNSRIDTAPYVGLVIEEDARRDVKNPVGRLLLVNCSWQPIKAVTLEFDIIGQKHLSNDQAERWVSERAESQFAFTVKVGDIGDFSSLNLVPTLKAAAPNIEHYLFAAGKSISVDGSGNVTAAKFDGANTHPVVVSDEFATWYKQQPEYNNPAPLWIGGRMTSVGLNGEQLSVDFAAPIPLIWVETGNGGIRYDLVDFIELPIDGKERSFTKSIGVHLNDQKRTFRALLPLTARRSSFHQLRFCLKAKSGAILYQSSWAEAHIVVSPNDLKAVNASRRGGSATFNHKLL